MLLFIYYYFFLEWFRSESKETMIWIQKMIELLIDL